VLWQQGRIGISQGTTGAELPPALLSRQDRHLLKSGFPAILRLLGGSTRERFVMARGLLPAHAALFHEAADTLSLVLWLQGRIGIRQGTSGAELPPNLLGRHDRQVLKSGFRVIHRLIELTANYEWLDAL